VVKEAEREDNLILYVYLRVLFPRFEGISTFIFKEFGQKTLLDDPRDGASQLF